MRMLIVLTLIASLAGCYRLALDKHLDNAYREYDASNCNAALLELSEAERDSQSRPYMQPEISMLRGQCLEREMLYPDAMQTYTFIIDQYPQSEYAYRAKARIDTLQRLGYGHTAAIPIPLKVK